MSGLFGSLNSTATAIQAHSRSVELAGRNIAHMNDPTYARQRVVTGSTGTVQTAQGPQSSGLTALGFEQIRDTLLDRQLLAEISHEKGLEAGIFRIRQALSSMGEYLDRTDDAQFIDDIAASGGGLRAGISEFFNAFDSFAARPNDPTVKQVLIQKTHALTEEFNRIDGRLQNLENTLNEQVSDDVNRVNSYLDDLNNLNREIAKVELGKSGSALDLRDQRQAKLEELAGYIAFTVVETPDSNGQISILVQTSDGTKVPLIAPAEQPMHLGLDAAGLLILKNNPTVSLDISAGSLPAIIDVRDQTLTELRGQMDSLVEALVTEVNSLYSTTGNDFFDATGLTAATFTADASLTFASLQSTTTANSGANDLAQAIADLANKPLVGLGQSTATQFASRMVTDLAQDTQNRQNRFEVQASVRELIQGRRDAISGVSLDEEVSQLLIFQRAFQASSRVFNVIDEMLNTLITQVGV